MLRWLARARRRNRGRSALVTYVLRGRSGSIRGQIIGDSREPAVQHLVLAAVLRDVDVEHVEERTPDNHVLRASEAEAFLRERVRMCGGGRRDQS